MRDAVARAGRALAFPAVVLVSLLVLFTPATGVPTGFPGADKIVHAALFAALVITGRLAEIPLRPLIAGLFVYAVGSEAAQDLLPLGRSADPVDVLADAVGVAAGWLVVRRR